MPSDDHRVSAGSDSRIISAPVYPAERRSGYRYIVDIVILYDTSSAEACVRFVCGSPGVIQQILTASLAKQMMGRCSTALRTRIWRGRMDDLSAKDLTTTSHSVDSQPDSRGTSVLACKLRISCSQRDLRFSPLAASHLSTRTRRKCLDLEALARRPQSETAAA